MVYISTTCTEKQMILWALPRPTKFGFDNIGKRNAAKKIAASLLI
jgi:hypothetical protein